MKQGKSLVGLAEELTRQAESKRDFIVSTDAMGVYPRHDQLRVHLDGKEHFTVNEVAHEQLSAHLKIPKQYYDRMRAETPDLLAENVNTWLHCTPEKRMVRTLDGRMRAFLSDRYRPLDNYDLAEMAFPALQDVQAAIKSCEITERRMYLQAVCEHLAVSDPRPKNVGDIVQAGIVVSNSEVGLGSLRVEPMVYRLSCMNGAITGHALKKYHIGRKQATEEQIWEVLSDEARQADDKAFFLKARDIIRRALDELAFEAAVRKMQQAAANEIEGDASLEKVVEITAERFALTDGERESALKHLIQNGDLSQYGLGNAVTRAANDVESYDRAIELERFGGQVWELPKRDWQAINGQAAA